MIKSIEQRLISDVTFDTHIQPEKLHFDPALGFLRIDSPRDKTQIVGFGADLLEGPGSYRGVTEPVVQFDMLPSSQRTIDLQGKGVGPRLYNTAEGPWGAKVQPKDIGVFVCTLAVEEVCDWRKEQGTTLQQIWQQLLRIKHAEEGTVEGVVEDVHAQYAAKHPGARAVQLKTPPQPLLRMGLRGKRLPEGLTSQFLVIRDPNCVLYRIGSVGVSAS
ncbi:MAG: hypothetical protein WAQ24_01785 [Candidatus Saccharimonadales bacterium]